MPERANIEAPAKDFEAAPVAAAPAVKKKWTPMAVLGFIGATGATIIALNTFTGLNFRPAWGYEVEQLVSDDVELQLNKGQYELRLHQIDRERRELRRELADHQSRAQEFRNKNEPVPSWLRSTIADTETSIKELGDERRVVETKLLGLGG